MRLVQFLSEQGDRRVGLVESERSVRQLLETERIYDLAVEAHALDLPMTTLIEVRQSQDVVDYDRLLAEKRLLPPFDHPDPTHFHLSGTALTGRDVTQIEPVEAEPLSQPEWFYKGNGHLVVSPEQPLISPEFARGDSEAAELVGLYVISRQQTVIRVGFALGNQFSDRLMAEESGSSVAQAQLRPCSFGPELLLGQLPAHIEGQVRIVRAGTALWRATFLTGGANLLYKLADLEHHHFKHNLFRQPGDAHCHFLGATVLSVAPKISLQSGDRFEISAPRFGRPLRNEFQR